MTDLTAWAQRVAASMPPLTPSEIAVVGRLAAKLDARIAAQRAPGPPPHPPTPTPPPGPATPSKHRPLPLAA